MTLASFSAGTGTPTAATGEGALADGEGGGALAIGAALWAVDGAAPSSFPQPLAPIARPSSPQVAPSSRRMAGTLISLGFNIGADSSNDRAARGSRKMPSIAVDRLAMAANLVASRHQSSPA